MTRAPLALLLAAALSMCGVTMRGGGRFGSHPAGFYIAGPAGLVTTGGAGYPTFLVTNTSDSIGTSGSLRWANQQAGLAGGGTIQCGPTLNGAAAGGTIVQANSVLLFNDNITLDFSGCPGRGLAVAGRALSFGHNNIWRYVRHVGNWGATTAEDSCMNNADGGGNDRVVLDHVSISGCEDEAVSWEGNYFTIQNSLVGPSGNTQHSTFVLAQGNYATFYRNFTVATTRNPRIDARDPNSFYWIVENLFTDFVYGSENATDANEIATLTFLRNIWRASPPRTDPGASCTGLFDLDGSSCPEHVPIGPSSNVGPMKYGGADNVLYPSGAGRTFNDINPGVFPVSPTPLDVYHGDGANSNVANGMSTAACDTGVCAQRLLVDVQTPRFFPVVSSLTPAQLIAVLANPVDGVGATRPCRLPTEQAVIDAALSGGPRKLPFPPRYPPRSVMDVACKTPLSPPTIVAGADSSAAGLTPQPITATVTASVERPTVSWRVTSGDGPGEPCERGAQTTVLGAWPVSTDGSDVMTVTSTAGFDATANPGGKVFISGFWWPHEIETATATVVDATHLDVTRGSPARQYRDFYPTTIVRAAVGTIEWPWREDTYITPRNIAGSCTLEAKIWDGAHTPVTDTMTVTTPAGGASIPATNDIVYVNGETIWSMDDNGANDTQLTFDASRNIEHVALSPDRRYIASTYDTAGPGSAKLELYDLLLGTRTQLLPSFAMAGNGGVDWDQSGRIYFAGVQTTGLPDVWRVNLDGTGATNLTNNASYGEADVSVSPDGTKIAFKAEAVGSGDQVIRVANADGTGQLTIVTAAAGTPGVFDPEHAPGGAVVFYSKQNATTVMGEPAHDIWSMNASGTGSPSGPFGLGGAINAIPDPASSRLLAWRVDDTNSNGTIEAGEYLGAAATDLDGVSNLVKLKLGSGFPKWIQ